MCKITLCILSLFVFFCQKTRAQNLVPDWSFEYKKGWGCQQNDSLQWFDPYYGLKAGYQYVYSRCAGANCNGCVPKNILGGYQWPRHGQNYSGLENSYLNLDISGPDTGSRAYAEIKLSMPLMKDSTYYCEFFLSLTSRGFCATSDFGMYISSVRIIDSPSNSSKITNALPYNPQVENSPWRILADTQFWTPVSGLYTAHGGEQYIIVGDFMDNGHSHTNCPGDSNKDNPSFSWNSYYLDDVSVTPVQVFLHSTDTVCHGSYLLYPRYKGVGCLWPDGTHGDSFLVTKPGVYLVVYDSVNYAAIDSITVIYRNLIRDIHDTVLCAGTSYSIKLPSTNTYIWQDGSRQDSISVNKSGKYWVNVTNGSCSFADSFSVRYDSVVFLKLPLDTTICQQFPWSINLNNISYPITWQDGSTAKLYTINKSGLYAVSVINVCNSPSVQIDVHDTDCTCAVYTPNAFAPGTGHNDSFRSVSFCNPVSFNMYIYNRWGERIFQSNDINKGWDGTFKGADAETGVYFYIIDYIPFGTTDKKTIKGTVQLLR